MSLYKYHFSNSSEYSCYFPSLQSIYIHFRLNHITLLLLIGKKVPSLAWSVCGELLPHGVSNSCLHVFKSISYVKSCVYVHPENHPWSTSITLLSFFSKKLPYWYSTRWSWHVWCVYDIIVTGRAGTPQLSNSSKSISESMLRIVSWIINQKNGTNVQISNQLLPISIFCSIYSR